MTEPAQPEPTQPEPAQPEPAPTAQPRLLIVDVSDRERADPAYGRVLRELSGNVAATAESVGFAVERVASDDADLDAALARTDAVLLTGGEDVDPSLYGGEADYPGREEVFGDADLAQTALVRAAVAGGVPLIGICRGMQVVNVALGGDLVQHIHDGGHVVDGAADAEMLEHSVTVEPTSSLAAVVGATDLVVRSSHHQAVGRPGRGLRVVARADDGVIEAVEHESAPVWAVQWHPEDGASTGTVLRDLLTAARDAARDATREAALETVREAATAGSKPARQSPTA